MALVAISESNLSNRRFDHHDFSNQDLKGKKLTGSVFHNCNFDHSDMSDADCTGSDFTGSSMRGTNCFHTNFRDAKLACTIWEPRDARGCALTMDCATFQNAKMSPIWAYSYLLFLTSTTVTPEFNDNLISCIGANRYIKLKALLERRDLV